MLFSAISERVPVLASAVFFSCIGMGAQTLEHRPPATPAAPPEPASATRELAGPPVLAAGTTLQVESVRHYPMKAGESIEGRLVYPLYVNGKLAVPEGTPVRGAVTALEPDASERLHGRLQGDFTPFHNANVRFTELVLPDGARPITTSGASTGAMVLRLAAPGARPKQSLIARQWSQARGRLHEQIAFFTDPGLGDRATQMLYHQLPYHPERIPAHTSWTFELAAPLTLPDTPAPEPPPVETAQQPAGGPETWSVHALLTAGMSSATSRPGDPVRALVVEPVLDKDKQVVVPQGSILVGHVTTAKAARTLGRNGKLRFIFQQVQFPESAASRPVQGALAGATTQGTQTLNLDAEGTVTPKNQSSVIAPLLLTMLAGRALDNDGNLTVQTGVASNGFGLVGRVVGIVAGNRNFAAGLGFYAAGLSFYQNFLRPGHDVIFPKDTRIEIETTPLRAPVLKPDGQ
ncbi:MAG TPA: hypothetical protein VGL00_07625 [Terracidiphilus sp.]